MLQFSDGSLERINQQLLQRLGVKSRDSPVTELASAGHISAALQVVLPVTPTAGLYAPDCPLHRLSTSFEFLLKSRSPMH